MLKISELAMPKSRKVTTVCNGKCEVWTDYEEARAYFLELVMSTDGRSMIVRSAFIFNFCTDLMSAAMKRNKEKSELSKIAIRSFILYVYW